MPVVTISRQMCAFGDEIAEALARRLGWELVTRGDLFTRFPDLAPNPYDRHMLTESAKYYLRPIPERGRNQTFLDGLTKAVNGLLDQSSAVLVGFGSQMICSGRKDAVHLRIIAGREDRIRRAKKEYRVSREEAERILDTADRKHRKFVSTVFSADLGDPSLYHMVLNTSTLTAEACVAAAETLVRETLRSPLHALEANGPAADIIDYGNIAPRPALKNRSEEEFAQLLDMYQIDWTYEPKTFPIEWDAEGNVTMAFSPDFYLTKFDTYIELTTMDQRYVTLKNKKVKRLRELYPGTNIKVIYKKDFFTLAERFNLLNGAS